MPYPLFKHPPHCLALSSRIADVIQSERLDLIHAHYAVPNAAAALLARSIAGATECTRVVTTLHGTDIVLVGQDPSFRAATLWSMENSDALTAVSSWLASETARRFRTSKPIRVIPNFVDGRFFRPDPSRPRVSSGVVCVHLSNFRPVKQVRHVVLAFSAMVKALPPDIPAQLWFVGAGPEQPAAEEEAARLKLAHQVRFLGERLDVEAILARSHFFILTSKFESFGLAALEAMACGAVPLAYRAGGLPEVIRNRADGVLVHPGDWEALGRAAASLARSQQKYDKLSAAARAAAAERFPLERGVDAYESLFMDLLAPGP